MIFEAYLSGMTFRLSLILFICAALLLPRCFSRPPIICRDPDVGGTQQNSERKFLLIGHENAGGAGLGNLLIFFPAAFYFAAFTGRDIVITDRSIFGEMCSIITCGFPFLSQLEMAFPEILSERALHHIDELRATDFQNYIEGMKKIDNVVVRAGGYMSKSDWWVYFNRTVDCVHKITGCDAGDVTCAEHHAYQRLIRGPFRAALTVEEESRIQGVPDHLKHAILTLPHQYAPRLDGAIHLRTQFHHFEAQANIDDPAYRKEVADWLSSTEKKMVFKAMRKQIVNLVNESRPHAYVTAMENNSLVRSGETDIKPVYIYLAADNEQVKDALAELLERHILLRDIVHVMKVETKFVHHVKNLAKLKHATNNEGLMDLVFDWYALSLANRIYAWRKGSTGMVSSFVHSAQKMSGTTERTDNSAGRGIGTRGYQMTLDRSGEPRFDLFWVYSFLDDFAK